MDDSRSTPPKNMFPRWFLALVLGVATYGTAFWLRMQEWPSWQEIEYRLGSEMLLATHDAYHWVAGAEGFEFGVGHPMSELLRVLSTLIMGSDPAQIAFWLPPVMASLVALLVFAWAWSMGGMEAGVCAGILASLAPGFLARTLLGYCDTDLVTVFLPLMVGLAPACWVMRFLRHPLALPLAWIKRSVPPTLEAPPHKLSDMLTPWWTTVLALSGLLGWWAQEWHSMFPYLVRYNAALLGGMALILPQRGERKLALLAALVYTLPTLTGFPGLILALLVLALRLGKTDTSGDTSDLLHRVRAKGALVLLHPVTLFLLWIMAALFLVDMEVINTMFHHVQGYLKRSGDPAPLGGGDPLIYPSVSQSIIEVQDLSVSEILAYFHPWTPVALLGLVGFGVVLCARSGALFLLPLVALAFLSTKMGGRMVMFGAPVVALGLTLPVDWLACALGDVRANALRRVAVFTLSLLVGGFVLMPDYGKAVWAFWMALGELRPLVFVCATLMIFIGVGRHRGWPKAVFLDKIGPHLVYRAAAVAIMLTVVIPPLAELIPAMTHGPILNRRHADGLRAVRKATPEDAMLWVWWDWGYAAHHFSRRKTIADGAAHGGPSLFLPAAVFAADNPRYARQLIKYTALHENEPGNVFKDMTGTQASRLIARLKNPNTPLIQAPGKQYITVSVDMLELGFWISTFGNWDFQSKTGKGHAISIVPQQLAFRLDRGEVVVQGTTNAIPAATIDLFEDGRLVRRNYLTPPENPANAAAEKAWRDDVERRRNVHFLFNRVTGEKFVVDDNMYNTLMVQLLLTSPNNPLFKPYFRLIYDNVFCRVYEVL